MLILHGDRIAGFIFRMNLPRSLHFLKVFLRIFKSKRNFRCLYLAADRREAMVGEASGSAPLVTLVLGTLLGALSTGAMQIYLAERALSRRRRSVARALAGEIDAALMRLEITALNMRYREIRNLNLFIPVDYIDLESFGKDDHIRKSHSGDVLLPLNLQEFPVFDKLIEDIYLLPDPLPFQVSGWYMLMKGISDDKSFFNSLGFQEMMKENHLFENKLLNEIFPARNFNIIFANNFQNKSKILVNSLRNVD